MDKEQIEIKFKTNFFSKEKTIVLSDKSISLSCNYSAITQFDKEDIKYYRFGIRWIRGVEFCIGRLYCIDLKNGDDKIIKIRLRSVYGINKHRLHKKYGKILNLLYDYYFDEKISNYINRIESGTDVEIGGVIFKKEGICLKLKNNGDLIKWEDLNTRAYTHYYTLSSKEKPDIYKAFTYLTDWNVSFVYSISRQILSNKGLYKEEK